jgi:hypothetical protein
MKKILTCPDFSSGGGSFFVKKVYFCTKIKKMTDTIAMPTATNAQVKAAILELIKENDPQFQQWIKTALSKRVPKSENGQVKKTRPRSKLPFWKAHPELEPLTPPKGGSINKEILEKLQELFKDAPPAEEIISYLTK